MAPDPAPLVGVEALLDEFLLHRPTVRVEAGELEVLLELEIHVVLAATVLLDRRDDPVAETLGLVRVELDVDLGDDVVLLVEDEDDVGLVVDGRRAAQVEVAEARRLEPFLVGGDERTMASYGISSARKSPSSPSGDTSTAKSESVSARERTSARSGSSSTRSSLMA
jgi:hypothetical protein